MFGELLDGLLNLTVATRTGTDLIYNPATCDTDAERVMIATFYYSQDFTLF